MPDDERQTIIYMPGDPPTATAQRRAVRIVNGKPVFYEPPAVRKARAALRAGFAAHAPQKPAAGPLRVEIQWHYAGTPGTWHVKTPDLDNAAKLLLDVLTGLGYWTDDRQIAMLVLSKRHAAAPGIVLAYSTLTDGPSA